METTRLSALLGSRRALLLSDLSALAANYRALGAHLAKAGVSPIAVVKANAYGHGAAAIAGALYAEGARRFAVATVEEASALVPLLPASEILVLTAESASILPVPGLEFF